MRSPSLNRRSSRAALPFLATLAISSGALAQPAQPTQPTTAQPAQVPASDAERERLVTRAQTMMSAGRFADAVPLLRAVLALRPTPQVRYALAFSALRSGDLRTARDEATACVEETAGSSGTLAAVGGQCVDILARMRAVLSEGSAPPSAPAAAIPVAAPRPAMEPTPRPEYPPPHAILRGPGEPPSVDLFREPRPVETPRHRERPGVPSGAIATFVLGGASLAASGLLGLAYVDALSGCRVVNDVAICPHARALEDARRADDLAVGVNVTLAVGLVALTSGLLWWIIDRATSP